MLSRAPAPSDLRAALIASIALVVITLAIYSPVLWCDFIGYDDPLYVTANRHVQRGLAWPSIKWAFETGPGHAANYHPLTWLSHMMDVQVFGLRAGAHHFVSVAIHAGAAVALFWFLLRATGMFWASVAVAGLFAWHPMHVESVAWVAERKDVLSGLMFFLMLLAYVRYVRARGVWNYLLVVVLFVLGLLAKPMLVTAPFVLLLVDRWPLRRPARWGLLVEKIPLFVLAGISSVMTFIIQRAEGAMRTEENLPLAYRLMNVPVAYVRYLLKLIWPSHLSVFYPYQYWQPAHVAAAMVLLVVITVLLLIAWRRGREYPLIGWLWFLGMLVPVIGIVQVGSQSMADRYSYLPSVGLFIVVCFAACDWRARRDAIGLAGIVVAMAMIVGTFLQLRHWRDELTLFRHAAAVTQRNHVAEGYVGKALAVRGDVEGAIKAYDRALEYHPNYAEAHYNLGNLRLKLGEYDLAINAYRTAIKHKPALIEARNNLGIAYAARGFLDRAEAELRQAIQIDPEYADARASLGRVLLRQGKNAEAAEAFRAALRIDPDLAVARRGLNESQATTRP